VVHLAVSGSILGRNGLGLTAGDAKLAPGPAGHVLLVVGNVVQCPAGGKDGHEQGHGDWGKLDWVGGKVLRLQSPQVRHHDGKTEDIVEGKPLMGTIKGLKKPNGETVLVVTGVSAEMLDGDGACAYLQVLIKEVLGNNDGAEPNGQNHRVGDGAKLLALQGGKRQVAALQSQ